MLSYSSVITQFASESIDYTFVNKERLERWCQPLSSRQKVCVPDLSAYEWITSESDDDPPYCVLHSAMITSWDSTFDIVELWFSEHVGVFQRCDWLPLMHYYTEEVDTHAGCLCINTDSPWWGRVLVVCESEGFLMSLSTFKQGILMLENDRDWKWDRDNQWKAFL